VSYSDDRTANNEPWPPEGSKEALLLRGMNRAQRRAFLREQKHVLRERERRQR
jgi:hypothetical protein